MGDGSPSLVEEAQCYITKAIPCANPSDACGRVYLYLVDMRQVNNQIPVCAPKAVASMRVTARTRYHFRTS